MKPPIKINLKSLAFLKSGSKDEFFWDRDLKGFGVKVLAGSSKTPQGALVYVYQYRLGGRGSPSRRYTIGRHGSPWTPTSARAQAERLAIMVAQGKDPIDIDKARAKEAKDLAFDRYIVSFYQEYLLERWKKAVPTLALLRRYAVPSLRNKPVNAITKADIHRLFINTPGVASRKNLHSSLRKMFLWAVNKGDLPASPMVGIEPPPTPKARSRHLTEEEIACFWQATESAGLHKPVLRLLLSTGQRREEVNGLAWEEINQSSRLWELPEQRAKNNHASRVHLNRHAVNALDEAALAQGASATDGIVVWPRTGLIFTTTGRTPYSGYGKAKVRLNEAMLSIARDRAQARGERGQAVHILPWVLHDLRRTTATMFQKMGVSLQVTEAMLNHVSGSRAGIVGVYQRHDYWSEKVAASEEWANFIDRLIEWPIASPDNVIQLAARG